MERRRITKFLWTKHKIGRRSRWLTFATIIQERTSSFSKENGSWVDVWGDIAWDDDDTPRPLDEYTSEIIPPPRRFDPAFTEWGETWIAKGEYSICRESPAQPCEFATWKVSGSNHQGFAQVYGRANAERIMECLTACEGMEDPVSEIAALRAAAQKELA